MRETNNKYKEKKILRYSLGDTLVLRVLERGRTACNERKRGISPHLVVILIAVFVAANY